MEWGQVASGSAVRVGSVLAQDPDAVEVTDLHGVREVMQDVAVEKRHLVSRLQNFFIFVTDEETEHTSACPGNTKGGSITVSLTSCLTGLD